MSYEDTDCYEPTRAEVDRELRKHGCKPLEFWIEWREKRPPTGMEVLDWLGY